MAMRVDFQARAAIGQVRIGNETFQVYPTADMVRALRTVQDSVNAVESGLAASEIAFVPAGSVTATNLQAALEEVDSEKASASALASHTGNTSNPHGVTKGQAGLGNVDNTSDLDKPVSTATQTALNLKADAASLGTMSAQDATAVAITGGAMNGTPVGGTTPAAGSFTTVKTASVTVGALPAAGTVGAGARYFVTDATATTFNSIVGGGGANGVPVFCDGASWRIG